MNKADNYENICKCGRKLEEGETLCPACKGDSKNFFDGAVTVLGGVVALVLGVASLFLKRK